MKLEMSMILIGAGLATTGLMMLIFVNPWFGTLVPAGGLLIMSSGWLRDD